MRLAVVSMIARLMVVGICAAGLRVPSFARTLRAQTAPRGDPASSPQSTQMTRHGYREDQGDLHAEMELQATGSYRALIISFHRKDGELSTLEDQARIVDRMLARVLRDHPELVRLEVMFGEGRESFIPPLDAFLARSPEWNSRTGLPRHGRSGDYLVQVLNAQGILEPLRSVFKERGFAFKLDGINRIDIEKMPLRNNARLPKYIDVMYFSANKSER